MLTVRIGRQRVIAKNARHLNMEQGDKVVIALDVDHLYQFDLDTGDPVRD